MTNFLRGGISTFDKTIKQLSGVGKWKWQRRAREGGGFFSEVAHYLSIREDTRSGTNELDLDRIKELLDVLRHISQEFVHRSVGELIILHRLYEYAANS